MKKIAILTTGVVAAGMLSAGVSQALSGGTTVPEGAYKFLAKGNANGFDAPIRQWDGGEGNWPAQSAKLL